MIAGDNQHATSPASVAGLQKSRDERQIGARNGRGHELRRAEVLFLVLGRDPMAQQVGLKSLLDVSSEWPERIDLHRPVKAAEAVVVRQARADLNRVRGWGITQHR